MIEPKEPDNESQRLSILKQLNILDTPLEERFERITRIVCSALDVPIAAVSLVDEERQWFKSIQGIPVPETPRNIAFCAHTILDDKFLVVNDALEDPRFVKNPLVTEYPGIRFYAGCPLVVDDNIRLGTLCAIDTSPREFDEAQMTILKDLTKMAITEVASSTVTEAHQRLINDLKEAERAAMIDALTRTWNRRGGGELFAKEWEEANRKATPMSVALLDLDHFKTINDMYGHDAGDEVLRQVTKTFLSEVRPYDIVSRWGGEEFLIIMPGCDQAHAQPAMQRLLEAIKESPAKTSMGKISFTASIGAVTTFPANGGDMCNALKLADDALYTAKRGGRDQVIIA